LNRFFHGGVVDTVQAKQIVDECMRHVAQRVIGQEPLLKRVLVALIAGGHVLVEGVPGIAKTLMISTIAQLVGLPFKRIQFTPDLLPSDLTGMSVFKPDEGKFVIEKGPVFTNIVLADEINRAPPKVQSALLEVMAEKQVTIFGQTLTVEPPYFVMATQNPIEQEGTYTLPEAQLDRFMFKLLAPYPNTAEERLIAIHSTVQTMPPPVQAFLKIDDLRAMQKQIDAIHIDDRVIDYAVDLVVATRDKEKLKSLDLGGAIQWGASPRATLWLIRGARTLALVEGRDFVTPHDIKEISKDVLRHRLILSYEAQADGLTPDAAVDQLLQGVPSP
jgi:MoxR-like ATPase